MQYNTNTNSSWWLGDSFFDKDIDVLTGEVYKDKTADLIKLAGYRRAISNFVNIVTGQNIPVTFKGSDSYTDGKEVVLSATLSDKDFDAAVGLALHEGSHIKLTDFKVLENLLRGDEYTSSYNNVIPAVLKAEMEIKYGQDYGITHIRSNVQQLLNIIEDRRIDNYIFKSAPGYKGYYHSLYEKYFNAKIIDKGLLSDEFRILDWGSYMFRICNITNENRDVNALPGLKEIWKVLGLSNIDRIKNTSEALEVAFEIFRIVESNLPPPKVQDDECDGEDDTRSEDAGKDCDGEGASCSSPTGTKKSKTPQGGAPSDDGSKAEGEEAKVQNESGDGDSGKDESFNPTTGEGPLSPRQLKQLLNAINKQKDFINNNVKKTKMNKTDQKKMKSLEDSGSEIKKVGSDYKNHWGPVGTTECIVIKKLTQSLIDSNMYSFLGASKYSWRAESYIDAVAKGVRLGTMLGKKLKLRSEERNTKFSRLDNGKIDKRLIASLGFGAERIFEQTMNDKYTPANVHISIDNSGSMGGDKFLNCQTSVVAIAKAASMVDNLDIQVSYRTTQIDGKPIILIAYDSRTDSFRKIQKLFHNICPSNLTPEGLTFEAIQNLLVSASGDKESYFINFSDGEPYCSPKGFEYYGSSAATHTRGQIDKMRKRGIKVLSYFISGQTKDRVSDMFQRMYGADAANVNVTNLLPLAKTLNKLFLKK